MLRKTFVKAAQRSGSLNRGINSKSNFKRIPLRWLFHNDYRSFYFLNATQFLGALNDNVFKLLVIYLLISVKGPAEANIILSLAGAIFVIPFLLFSSGAGVLADRKSKRTIIVWTKVMEVGTMLFGLFSVSREWGFGSYVALFLMGAQSAIFGPSKYGIIPELVEEKMVSKANGSITSFTYLAIILGTFLASYIAKVTDRNFFMEAIVCVGIAVIGLLTSLGIKRTKPQQSQKRINPLFLYEIYQTLKIGWQIPHLLPAIFASSFFLFIGAFTQLNIIPFAMQSLHLTDIGGGFLFLATAIGIAIGAVLAGQLSKDQVEPGISCISGFFIALFFFLLWIFSSSLIATILLLGLLGVVGGGYLIPFDAFLQVKSPEEKRGRIIAAANFFSFIGVFLAAFFLYLISENLGFSAASGFAIMGILSLIANIIVTGRMSELFFPFFIKKILKHFRKLHLASPIPSTSQVVILQSNSWWDAILLFSCLPRLKILVPDWYFRSFPWFNGLVDSIKIVPPEPESRRTFEKLLKQAKKFQKKNNSVCLFFHSRTENGEMIEAYRKIFEKFNYDMIYAHGVKEKVSKKILGFHFYQKRITLMFSKEPL